ncbi:Pga2p Ecym_6381 [Eremothecium cymbalariae DBVPG|uniref:Processing of GAS1 and ALP protein 2 n=1 Tax=Eremothecium cymbalariae (strain CBS 270.75 / DBVPG 7215 / KCTC 17166 / NRRL Y-17582) TaxID=931890 RepID=G8JUH6_ERECY|nr:hypothetical protein Ecym_6381 [Eremothecium cymbalariae DBVPG\
MDLLENIKKNLIGSFDIDVRSSLRLVVIVGGYILIRNHVQKIIANRELKRKLKEDEDSLSTDRMNSLVEDPDKESESTTTAFGWGETTRMKVKKQEKLLEEKLQTLRKRQGNIDDDDDKDIEDLLED